MTKDLGNDFLLSIITPFYNENDAIDNYFKTIMPILKGLGCDYEIICIDDGSQDITYNLLKKKAAKDKRIKVIKFSRNFGKEAALTAGLARSIGDAVIPIDADLQDPPKLITSMVKKWKQGFEVVNAMRIARKDSWFKNFFSQLYHKLISLVTDGRIPADIGDFRLIDRKVVNQILRLKERNRYMKGIFAWVGFKTTVVKYSRPKRSIGETKFSFLKLFRLALDGIFGFSGAPLKVWLYTGVFLSFLSLIYVMFLMVESAFYGVVLEGYSALVALVLFIGGIQLISLGVIGEYILRIFREVKQRPIYIESENFGFEENENKS